MLRERCRGGRATSGIQRTQTACSLRGAVSAADPGNVELNRFAVVLPPVSKMAGFVLLLLGFAPTRRRSSLARPQSRRRRCDG